MSINIYSEPNVISTPYRPCFIDCSSDLGTITRMIGDVYINDVLKATIDKDPILGSTNTFRFEIGDVLKKYLISEFFTNVGTVKTNICILSSNKYYIRTFEILDNGTTLDTSWSEEGAGTNYAQSTTAYSFNGVNQHTQTFDDYLADGTTKNILTNRPQYSKVLSNAKLLFGALTRTKCTLKLIEYDGLNGTGSVLATTIPAIETPTYCKMSFGVDVGNVDPATKSISVTVFDSTVALTQPLVMNLTTLCGEETTLYWQNHWGEFDTHYFAGRNTEKTKTKKTSIDNRLNLNYNVYDRGEKNITVDNERTYEMWTTTENKDVIAWLAEIGESVDVFIMDGTNRIPIIVKSVTTTILDSEKLVTQISVKYTMSNKRINQNG